jgi:hypothetical protein
MSGPESAISFTDDTSPDTRRTRQRHVSIHATVIKEKRHDWYYEILKLFPGFKEELKSTQVLESYKNLPREKQQVIWNTLKDVHIHITDSLPLQASFEKVVQNAVRRPDGFELLKQRAYQGDETAKKLLGMVNDGIAKSIIRSGLSKHLKSFIRDYEPPGSLRRYLPKERTYFDDSDEELLRLKRARGSVVKNAVVYTSKSGAAFSGAMDVFSTFYGSDFLMRRRLNQAVEASHAFDKGNERAIDWLEDERRIIAKEILMRNAYRYGYEYDELRLSPLYSIDSRKSLFVQAADIAAGIAKYLYEIGSILEVTLRFDYVTFNGWRISQDDAAEKMKEWKQKGYL